MSNSRALKRLCLVYNLKNPAFSGEEHEEYDEPSTIEALRDCFRGLGYGVDCLEQTADFPLKIASLKPDFVFNIAEGLGSGRNRESQVPCVLESLDIAYSGSDPFSLSAALDKYAAWRLLKMSGVAVPDMISVNGLSDIKTNCSFFTGSGPWVVKPRWEGSSKGISFSSLVKNSQSARVQIERVCLDYRQPAVVESFLPGFEITAGVCGNSAPFILGMMKIGPRAASLDSYLYSRQVKRDWENQVVYEPQGAMPFALCRQVEKAAISAFLALELRDFARIDFRLDKEGTPRVIDVNPLPGLSPHYSDLPILWRLNGGSYPELVKIILEEALKRCGFC